MRATMWVCFYLYVKLHDKDSKMLYSNMNEFKIISPAKKRMKTFISSEALSHLGAEKIAFPPIPNGQTDRQTDIRAVGH